MLSNLRKAIVWGLLLVLISVLLPAIQPVQAGGQLTEPTPPTQLYLPLITKPPVYLFGKVTFMGNPVANQSLILYLFGGGNPPVVHATIFTNTNGDYQVELPFLSTGQGLQLYWVNTAKDNRWLSSWICTAIRENPVNDVNCSFDIEDIQLVAPQYWVVLPYTFSWTKRNSTTDSYTYNLFDMNDANPRYSSDPLGYVDSYLLQNLPSGFDTHTPYSWWIQGCSASGCGISFYYYEVLFTTVNINSVTQKPTADLMNTQDWPLRRVPALTP